MVEYVTDAGAVTPDMISGLFVGWPDPPTPQQLVDVMDYEKLGFTGFAGAGIRNPRAIGELRLL
ncbi:hypothetical protein [Propioniciclava tarda]|uniref:Uncharacterized protein n=1 Tax=Propioniciclava tarda TaxID=433330 RepID=A0A4Q9KLV0_PROTD|nr:hypothetical protein [Propioniciclava tarda]TBT94930.1 hypothetical protein ET996_07905 [Propioniciclava tarda]SMO58180.1 hypothetical protein SAMN06266982_10787 [Propioniciclava tarda]